MSVFDELKQNKAESLKKAPVLQKKKSVVKCVSAPTVPAV